MINNQKAAAATTHSLESIRAFHEKVTTLCSAAGGSPNSAETMLGEMLEYYDNALHTNEDLIGVIESAWCNAEMVPKEFERVLRYTCAYCEGSTREASAEFPHDKDCVVKWPSVPVAALARKTRMRRLEAALGLCAERFREYEAAHLAKGTDDGRKKAARNADIKNMILEVLARDLPPTAEPPGNVSSQASQTDA